MTITPVPASVLPQQSLSQWLGEIGSRALRLLPPETAHECALTLLRSPLRAIVRQPPQQYAVNLRTAIPHIGEVHHPIGLGAGFDKNGVALTGLASLNFAFMEFGTVTPRSQAGNAKPRIFRQPGERALINRLGFNNEGAQAIGARLNQLGKSPIPLGINGGINSSTPAEEAVWDYVHVLKQFKPYTAFQVINVSSPNTTGLRQLANGPFLRLLADTLKHELGGSIATVYIKLAPDFKKGDFQEVIAAIGAAGFGGIIVSNTHQVQAPQKGGLSGHPLLVASTQCLEWAWEVHRGSLGMIGSGGILSGADVLAKLVRGAQAVEIYTALIYRGPWVVSELLRELEREMLLRGVKSVSDLVGTHYDHS